MRVGLAGVRAIQTSTWGNSRLDDGGWHSLRVVQSRNWAYAFLDGYLTQAWDLSEYYVAGWVNLCGESVVWDELLIRSEVPRPDLPEDEFLEITRDQHHRFLLGGELIEQLNYRSLRRNIDPAGRFGE